MTTPAALPGLAIILGAATGTLLPGQAVWPALGVLAIGWSCTLAAFVCRRSRACAAAVAVAFCGGAWAVAAQAERAAAAPPLRELVGRGPVLLEGRLREDAAASENGVSLALDVEREDRSGSPPPTGGGVRLTVAGTLGLDRAGEWIAGRRVRVAATLREPAWSRDPGVPDQRRALARKGIVLVGTVKSGALVEVVAPASAAGELGGRLRQATRAAVVRHVGCWSARAAAIVVAILIGDRAGLDPDVQRRLQEAGTYHVIAISGGNIAILAGLVLWCLRVVRVSHRLRGCVAMAVLTGYAALVGGGPSVVRATVMAVVYLLAGLADHRRVPLNSLAVAGALILLVAPAAVVDVGFWLTFGATLGILLGMALVGHRQPRRWWLRLPLALLLTSLAAEAALLPVSAYVFSRITFAGLLLNFAAIPLMAIAQTAGMLVLPLSCISETLATIAGATAYAGAEGLVRTAALVDLAPWIAYRLPPPPMVVVCGYYAAWAAWFWGRAQGAGGWRGAFGRAVRAVALPTVVACGVWVLVDPPTLVAPAVRGRLRVTVLDVGHGDATLVQLPDRRSLLVDAGGSMTGSRFDIGGRVVGPALWALGTRRLDVLVLTHADPDHIGGAASVLRDFRPREVWEGVDVPRLASLQALRQQAARLGARWLPRRAGEVLEYGEVTIRVWHPPPPDWERQRPRNDDSIVLDVRYGHASIVLAGDIGATIERSLLSRIRPAGLRALKVPHHGSVSSSSEAFVAAMVPHAAVLTTGSGTRVGEAVLQRYVAVGSEVLRTDRDGAVSIETDGSTLVVTTFTGRQRRWRVDGGPISPRPDPSARRP